MNPDILTVPLGDRAYDIFFGEEIYPVFQEWICRFFPGGSVFVVTDRNVASIYGDDIDRWLAGIPHAVHEIPPGEESKTLDTVRGIYTFLARGGHGPGGVRGGADRGSLVVAFGGGVVGDLSGFAAATWLRGLPYVQIPTTLLAQVDSSVGGKTGFNLPEGKNLVGAFHQPRAVFIDHTFLRTLDLRNLRSGMAEVVKCALAGDATLLSMLEERGGKWEAMPGEEWQTVIRRAVAFKASVVAKDERESSTRRVLNLGHTVGHAFEQASGYGRLLHGEAVAMGLAWEAVLGRRQGVTPGPLESRIVALLLSMGFALDDPATPLASIASALSVDKKRIDSDLDVPMATGPGACVLRRIPLSVLRGELPEIRAEVGKKALAAASEDRPAGADRLSGREAASPGASSPEEIILLDEGAFTIRLADIEAAPPGESAASPEERPAEVTSVPVRTITMADVYLAQGKAAEARRIVAEILGESPGDARALEWMEAHGDGSADAADSRAAGALASFLESIAKEYGYELSRPL